jgi:hypothetical protein
MRVFWILQATGWGLWLLDQLMWIVFDLVLKKQMPEMFSADALLFMAGGWRTSADKDRTWHKRLLAGTRYRGSIEWQRGLF